jgi:hypothetical protein
MARQLTIKNTIAKRINKCELILRYGFLRTPLALFDPSMNWHSISIHPLQARSRSVHRAIINVVQNIETNKSICACILREHAVFYSEHKTSSIKAPELITSLSNFAIEVQSLNLQNVDAILDSCCIHREKEINQFASRPDGNLNSFSCIPLCPIPSEKCFRWSNPTWKSSCWSTSQTAIRSCEIELGRNGRACEEILAEAL